MSTFRDREKLRYERQKAELFSAEACAPGTYKKHLRPFCLADGYSQENLYTGHREQAIVYFQQRGIPWHDGIRSEGIHNPSNHLCCSQSACVNALWPLTTEPVLLADAFRPFLPQIVKALPFDADSHLPDGHHPYLAFEWIGTKNYLGERGSRLRGAMSTSADFAFRYQRDDGQIGLVLGEWKYTEDYRFAQPKSKKTLVNQQTIYAPHYNTWRVERPDLPPYSEFFVEPFYQLMRLTLLARAMEQAHKHDGTGEMEADHVTVVHIAPRANDEFASSVQSDTLKGLGGTPSAIWAYVEPKHFVSIASEDLLRSLNDSAPTHLHDWGDYLLRRYGW